MPPRAFAICLLSGCFSESSDGNPVGTEGQGDGSSTTGAAASTMVSGTAAATGTHDEGGGTTGDDTAPGTSTDAPGSDGSSTTAADGSSSGGAPPMCGDGVADPGEQCDGDDLGGVTCPQGEVGPPACTRACLIDLDPCCKPTGATCGIDLGAECCAGSCGLDLKCN